MPIKFPGGNLLPVQAPHWESTVLTRRTQGEVYEGRDPFAAQGKGLLISSLFLLPSEWGWVEGEKTHDLCPTPAHAGWFSPLLVPAWILR